MDDFEGKVAVVTGTANQRGIRFATCWRLAGLGCRLVLADIDADGAAVRATEPCKGGAEAIAVGVDMADRAGVEAIADATYGRFGAAHVVMLNHVAPLGGPGHGLLSPVPDSWELHVRVNLLGVLFGIKAFVPRVIAGREHGHVLATTSGAGASGTMYGNGPYTVTKAAITSPMEYLHGQLRHAGVDIVASLVFPPLTNTFPADEVAASVAHMLKGAGLSSVMPQPDEVAEFTVEAIRRDSFWAHPDVADDDRLTGGRHRDAIDWENGIYWARAQTTIARGAPDSYVWGPPSEVLGP